MAVSKMIYFTGNLFEEATKGVEKGDVSKRINDLIKKGLDYEKGGDVSLEQALGYFNRLYKKKHPTEQLPLI